MYTRVERMQVVYNEGNGRLRRTVEEKGNETWEFQLLFWEIFFRASLIA